MAAEYVSLTGLSRRQGALSMTAKIKNGWIISDGCRIARYEDGLSIAFHDKDKRRSSARGTDQVEVALVELFQAVAEEMGLDIDPDVWYDF